jgi:H+/gluconate symporter-like permease
VTWTQYLFGGLLVAALLLMAFFYGARQLRQLRRLRQATDLPDDERDYEWRKARWRLVSSGLLLLLALLLASVLLFLEGPAQTLADQREALHQAGQNPPFDAEQKHFLRWWGGSWIAILLTLLAVVFLAALDLFATRRYGLRQHRKLQAERRDMIARQVSRLRQEWNERN